MTIAIDFDDTIHDTRNKLPGYRMGQPTLDAVETLQAWAEEGHVLVIFTARNVQDPKVYKAVKDWLDYFKLPYHGITNIKRSEFDLIIDNRAITYTNWAEISRKPLGT